MLRIRRCGVQFQFDQQRQLVMEGSKWQQGGGEVNNLQQQLETVDLEDDACVITFDLVLSFRFC